MPPHASEVCAAHQSAIIVGKGNSESALNDVLRGRPVDHDSINDYELIVAWYPREELAPNRRSNPVLTPDEEGASYINNGGLCSGQGLAFAFDTHRQGP